MWETSDIEINLKTGIMNQLQTIISAYEVQTNVVYKYSVNMKGGTPSTLDFIGMTTTTLSRRLTMHLQDGAIKQFSNEHNLPLNSDIIEKNPTVILIHCSIKKQLEIAEAIFALRKKPKLIFNVKE